jgi:hypothetical protein
MGVGAVISGDFFGWNLGIRESGFGGLLVATGLVAVMYFCMVYTVAELSSALPHAGGFFSFARSAMGPLGGFVCGLTDVIEYVITPAVIVIGVGGYLNELIFPGVETVAVGWSILWWILAYAIFVLINIAGVSISLRIGLVFAGLAALVVAGFMVVSCANDGVPESWDDQADDSGRGLAIRQFEDTCIEANDDLPSARSQSLCACVVDRVQDAVTYEKFRELDSFITKHRDELTAAMLSENYGWFTSAVFGVYTSNRTIVLRTTSYCGALFGVVLRTASYCGPRLGGVHQTASSLGLDLALGCFC